MLMAGPQGADLLGLQAGLVVQELGWDDDVDADLREDIMDIIDGDMIDEVIEAVDVVLLWWRDEDGDLVDVRMDARAPLADNGVVWLLTPKPGREGHVEPSEIAEAAPVAG